MKLKKYLIEIRKIPVTIKLKKVKDLYSKLISYQIDNWKILPSMSKMSTDTKGKSKPIYQIWNGNLKIPQLLPYEYKTLKKAKEALQSMINRMK